jgi:hypothetical protein
LPGKAVAVFTAGAAPGEGDLVLTAPFKQLLVDKLIAVVAVNAEHGEGQVFFCVSGLLFNPALGAIGQGAYFGPAGTDIGNGQSPAKLP